MEPPLHIIGVAWLGRRHAKRRWIRWAWEHGPANGATVIAATHDLSLAEAGDRRLEMVDGSLTASG